MVTIIRTAIISASNFFIIIFSFSQKEYNKKAATVKFVTVSSYKKEARSHTRQKAQYGANSDRGRHHCASAAAAVFIVKHSSHGRVPPLWNMEVLYLSGGHLSTKKTPQKIPWCSLFFCIQCTIQFILRPKPACRRPKPCSGQAHRCCRRSRRSPPQR